MSTTTDERGKSRGTGRKPIRRGRANPSRETMAPVAEWEAELISL